MSARDDKLAAALRDWDSTLRPNHLTLDQFHAILARHGLAVVPVEPTPEIVDAAFNADGWSQHAETYATIYRAMLAYATIYRAMLAAAQEDRAPQSSAPLFGSIPSDDSDEEVEQFLREIS